MTDQFELPSGLPEGPWQILENHIHDHWRSGLVVCDAGKGGIAAIYRREPGAEAVARAIASIPAMVEEIGKLQTAWHDAECGRDRLRALNAELESGLLGIEADCSELAEQCDEADFTEAERRTYKAIAVKARAIITRAILAKSQEVAS